MRVLIVDDEVVARHLLRQSLEAAGHTVLEAANGREALEILRSRACRLVVSDWLMPEMDGPGLCRAVRSEDLGGYVYIVILTARERTSSIVEALSAGADDCMSKPFEPAELAARLHAGERVLALETRDLTIFAMAKLVEARDPETGAHVERVRSYAEMLARDLWGQEVFADTIDAPFVRLIHATSPLHDIGKIAIPDCVLLKPGRLDEREFEIMKAHTTEGAATLDQALAQYPEAEFLRMARDIAAAHHERFDGTGYPQGLAGDDIPLAARIFSLADVYDALISRRVYKKAYTHEVARNLITEGRGTQFDPRIVDSFERLESRFIAIGQRGEAAVGEPALVQ